MQEEIMKVVRDALPGKVCEEVRKALEENDRLKEENDKLLEENEKLSAERDGFKKELAYHGDLDAKIRELDAKGAEIEKKERDLKVVMLEKEVACEKRINDNSIEILRNLTKNTMFKRDIYGSKTEINQNGCYQDTLPFNQNETITEE